MICAISISDPSPKVKQEGTAIGGAFYYYIVYQMEEKPKLLTRASSLRPRLQ